MAKKTNNEKFYGNIEYKMTQEMADAYLKARKGEAKKQHPQEYLCEVINTEFGVKGNCVKVLFF